jgi:parvulin-like peptidyl-prolyl isomerase
MPGGGGKKGRKTPSRPADNAVVLSAGGFSVTVGEAKRLLSRPMATHLSPGTTSRTKAETTVKDALYDKLTLAALRTSGFDREVEGETRAIRNRVVAVRFLDSVVDKRLAPSREEEQARYPKVWARARFRQITLPTREEAEAVRAAGIADPGSFEATARARAEGVKSDQGGLTAFLDPLPFNIMMTPEMDAALFALRPGEFSPVLESPLGFSVYQAVEVQRMSPEDVASKKRKIAARILEEKRGVYLRALGERFQPYNVFTDDKTKAYTMVLAMVQKGEHSAEDAVRAADTLLSFGSVVALQPLFKTPKVGKDDPIGAMAWLDTLVRQSILPDALLARAAEEEGFRLDEQYAKAMQERIARWQMDRFYELRVEPKTKVSDEEARAAYDGNREMFRRPRRVNYRVIETADEKKILEADRRMAGDVGFDAGWKWAWEKKANAAHGGGEHKGALIDEVGSTVRNALRGLPPGRRSPVLSSEGRYYIVSLDEVTEWEDLSFEAVREGIRGNLGARKRTEALAAFYEEKYPGLKLEANPAALDHIVKFFDDLIEERKAKGGSKAPPPPHRGKGAPGGKK